MAEASYGGICLHDQMELLNDMLYFSELSLFSVGDYLHSNQVLVLFHFPQSLDAIL